METTERDAPKQVIVMRRDLGMRRGKEIAQGAHASMIWLALRIREADYMFRNRPGITSRSCFGYDIWPLVLKGASGRRT